MMTTSLERTQLLDLYRVMVLIRQCEEQLARSHQRGLVHGACHTYVGQEAIAVGVCAHLRPDDVVFSTHRGHGHALAKGVPPRQADRRAVRPGDGLLARARREHAPVRARGRHDGHQRHRRPVHPPGGRGGLQLQAARRPTSVGGGVLRRRRGQQRRLPRGAEHGRHLEAAGAVRLREQPVRHRGAVRLRRAATRASPAAARPTACPASRSTATTCSPSTRPPSEAVERARAGGGPTLLECKTYRTRPHAEGMGDFTYRTREEVEEWKTRCPIARLRQHAARRAALADEPNLSAIDAEVAAQVAEAPASSPRRAPGPTRRRRPTHVYAEPRDAGPQRRPPAPAAREITFMQATLEALADGDGARTRRSSCMGEGIGKRGGNFKTTAGLYDQYGPERLCDTPICERGFVGLACGAAMTGTRPVIDFMFADFVLDARRRDRQPDRQDAVHEQRPAEDADPAARLHRHRPLGGDAPLGQLLPDVRPLPRPARGRAVDAVRRQGAAAPAPCAATTRCCSSNTASCSTLKGPVPEGDYEIAFGQAAVVREGSDVTVVALALMVHQTLEGLRDAGRARASRSS